MPFAVHAFLPSRRRLALLYLAAGVAAGLVSWSLGASRNLVVFRDASRDLFAGADLYRGASVDFFKYSPTFALLFAPLAAAPAAVAAALWGALNFVVAFLGLDAICDDEASKRRALTFALPAILLVTDGDQANLLAAGLMLLAVHAFERRALTLGALAIALAASTKIFPGAVLVVALLYPERERIVFRTLVATAAVLALPLVVLGKDGLVAQFASWRALVVADHANRGWSLVTIARDAGASGAAVQVALALVTLGSVVVGAKLAARAAERRHLVSALLLVVVLANHRAEYCTCVFPVIGLALWWAHTGGRARAALAILAVLALGPIFTEATSLGGILTAHRRYHPLRLAPLAIAWIVVLVDALRPLVARRLAPKVAPILLAEDGQ